MIDNIRAAIARYPYPLDYRAWPGPNSNTFTAYLPEKSLSLDLAYRQTRSAKTFCMRCRMR